MMLLNQLQEVSRMLPKLIGATLLYVVLAKISQLTLADQYAFLILWMPAGLALAQVLIGGNRYLWAVLVGALVAHGSSPNVSFLMSTIMAVASTAEAYFGAWLLKRHSNFDPEFGHLADFQRLIGLAGILATFATAACGTTLLLVSGVLPTAEYSQTLTLWWMGDSLGIILLTPFTLVWKTAFFSLFAEHVESGLPGVLGWKKFPLTGKGSQGPVLEALLILSITFLVGQSVFLGWFESSVGEYAKGYLMFLFVALAALRLGRHGTFAVLLMVAVQGLLSAHLGVGYFAQDIAESGLVNYWLYMMILALVGITLASYITAEQLDKETLREQAQFFRMITDNIDDLVAVLDLQGRRLYNSPSYGKLFGDPDNMLHSDSFAEVHPDDREHVRQVFLDTVNTGIGQRIEFRFTLPDQSVHFMESRGGVIRNSQGELLNIVVVSHDITERRKAEEAIRNLAYYDTLTQLPNRRMLQDRLALAMATSKRTGRYGALMMLDLDNFKPLNDKYGHAVGDLLLVEVARRIGGCVRQVDTVARLGGDEFVVVLSGLETDGPMSIQQAEFVAEKIRTKLAEPYMLRVARQNEPDALIEHRCTSSIGVVTFFSTQCSQEDLLSWADDAMYRSKENGRNQISFHVALTSAE